MKDKLLRIKLHQNKANYKKEETSENKMTYPLPPYSTIIGAIHNACNYKEYKDMDISIQGRFQSLGKEMYRDQAFLNKIEHDRNVLVKIKNPHILNDVYTMITRIESSKNKSKNKSDKKLRIDILDIDEVKEYIRLYKLSGKRTKDFDKFEEAINGRISELNLEKNESIKRVDISFDYSDNSDLNLGKDNSNKEIDSYNFDSIYKVLVNSIKYYEVLYDIDLVIHIRADKSILGEIIRNITNFTSLGRSEDFVEIEEVKFVNIYEDNPNDIEFIYNSGFILAEAVEKGIVTFKNIRKKVNKIKTKGTNYYINKNYEIQNKKRIFKKYRVGYLSEYKINFDELKEYNKSTDKNIYLDEDGYIVSLV